MLDEHPPHAVQEPIMFQAWNQLTFLHWPYQQKHIRPLVPCELELDTFQGAAWIGRTPFLLTGLRPRGLPTLPWLSEFPEMNIRTYVRGPDGEHGIWFFSLEADRLSAVVGARLLYGLPYRWADITSSYDSRQVEYTSRCHFGLGQAHITIHRGAPIQATSRSASLRRVFVSILGLGAV
jgi:uncharacterized protein YqjF (DUF2071 family)